MATATMYPPIVRLLLIALVFMPEFTGAEPIRGLLVYGHETHTLQPCGSDKPLWVVAKGEMHRQLQRHYQRLASKPYDPVYAELEGKFRGTGKGEFSKPYEGSFEVDAIVTVTRQDIEACRQGNPPLSAIETYVFECDDGSSYVMRTRPDEAWIFLPQGSPRLSPVSTSSGKRYAGEGFAVHILGETAQILVPGQAPKQCRNNRRKAVWERAKLDGADFRAVGNEPGWDLVIMDDRIVLNTDYGATRIVVPLPQPVTDQKNRTTVWKARDLTLEVIGRPCSDTMADETYESTVTVRLPEQTLHGCGMALH